MSENNLELILNGDHSDYEVVREAVASSMNDFRSSWFTFNGLERSIIFMMAPLGALVMIYPTWMLIMKHGYRRVFSIACLISTFLTAFLPWSIFFGFPYVLIIQFLLGATTPSALLLVPSVIRKWSTRKNDHFCFLVLSTFQQISPSSIYPIAAYISKSFFGWPVIFYFQSILSFIVTILFFYFYKETPIRHANVSDNELEKIQRAESVRGNIDYKKMLLCPQYQSVCFSIFIYFLSISFSIQYLPSYLYDIMDQSLEKTAWTISLIMMVHLVLKVFISRIFEKNPVLTSIYSIKFLSFASFVGSAVIMITFFVTKFHFEIQLILYVAIFAFLSLSWPSIFKSSNIISNKYYLPVMVRTHIILFYFSSLMSNILPLIFGRKDSWESWRYIWLVLSILLISSVIFFWLTFRFEKSDWDVYIPPEPPQPVRAEDIAPVSHPRPCRFTTSFDDEIVVSIISRGLDRCDTCKKHGIDARIHPTDENEVIPTRKIETPVRYANVSDNELEKIQRAESVRGNIDYKKMLLCPQYQSVCFSIFIYFLPISFFIQHLPSYLYDIMDQSLEKTAWTISLIMMVHLVLKVFISRIFEKNPVLTSIYSIKFLSFASFVGSAVIMITLFVTKFHFEIQLILYVAIFAFLSLSWPSIFKSSNIISNKYYLPVMVRTHIILFYFSSLMSNILPLIFGRKDSWESWRYIWLVLSILLISSVIFFWLTFRFEKSDWDVYIPPEPPQPVRAEDIAPVSHPRPCRFTTSFDDEIVVSIISRGLDRCDTCKKHGIDARIHPTDENEVIPTRKMYDELVQGQQDVSITRF